VLTADSIDKAICVKVMLPLSPSIVEFARYFEVKVYVESPKRCLYLYALILLDIFHRSYLRPDPFYGGRGISRSHSHAMLVSDRRLCERIVRANRSTRYSVPKTGNVCRQGYSRVSPRFLRSCPGWGLAPHISILT
jgi:hypothetical protein